MKFEEVLVGLKEGKDIVNDNWNGLKTGKMMYVSLQRPDENSLNTEPYFMFHSGYTETVKSEEGGGKGWVWKRFPWTPSALDMMSEGWMYREDYKKLQDAMKD